MNRSLLKKYALKGAKYGAIVGQFGCLLMAFYSDSRWFYYSVSNDPRELIVAGAFAVISPVIGAIVGSTYAVCKRYGFNDIINRNKKNMLYPIGMYALCYSAYYYGRRG